MKETTTYSFLDLAGSINHPSVGAFIFTGAGVGEVTIVMDTERTVHDVAADGSIMVSYISGNGGRVTFQVQQTSELYKWLLDWYNFCISAAENGDVSQWARTTIFLRNITDGSSHAISGVSPQKKPDKVYQAQGQKVTWSLMAADIHSDTA